VSDPDAPPLNTRALLDALEHHQVSYVAVGGLVSRVINSVSVFRMDGRDLTFDGIGQCAGSTWADGGGRQARPGAGKRQRIYDSGH